MLSEYIEETVIVWQGEEAEIESKAQKARERESLFRRRAAQEHEAKLDTELARKRKLEAERLAAQKRAAAASSSSSSSRHRRSSSDSDEETFADKAKKAAKKAAIDFAKEKAKEKAKEELGNLFNGFGF